MNKQSVTNKTQEIVDSMNKMKEIQKVCDNTPDCDSIFEKHRLPCMTIDVNENLSKTAQRIKRHIVLRDQREDNNRKSKTLRFGNSTVSSGGSGGPRGKLFRDA